MQIFIAKILFFFVLQYLYPNHSAGFGISESVEFI